MTTQGREREVTRADIIALCGALSLVGINMGLLGGVYYWAINKANNSMVTSTPTPTEIGDSSPESIFLTPQEAEFLFEQVGFGSPGELAKISAFILENLYFGMTSPEMELSALSGRNFSVIKVDKPENYQEITLIKDPEGKTVSVNNGLKEPLITGLGIDLVLSSEYFRGKTTVNGWDLSQLVQTEMVNFGLIDAKLKVISRMFRDNISIKLFDSKGALIPEKAYLPSDREGVATTLELLTIQDSVFPFTNVGKIFSYLPFLIANVFINKESKNHNIMFHPSSSEPQNLTANLLTKYGNLSELLYEVLCKDMIKKRSVRVKPTNLIKFMQDREAVKAVLSLIDSLEKVVPDRKLMV